MIMMADSRHPRARLEHKVIKILVPFTAAAGLLLGYVSSRLLPVTWRGNLWRTLLQIAIHFYVSRGKTTPICRSRDQMAWCMESIFMMKAYQVTAIKRNCRETVPTIAYPARQRSCHDQWLVAVAVLALRLRQRRCCDSECCAKTCCCDHLSFCHISEAQLIRVGWTNKSGRSRAPCWSVRVTSNSRSE